MRRRIDEKRMRHCEKIPVKNKRLIFEMNPKWADSFDTIED